MESDLNQQLLDNICQIYEGYSNEYRATTQPFYYQKYLTDNPAYRYDPESYAIRESLLEHVGSLPILATLIYPHINDAEVDLGQALIFLAIHDIGELATGDEITFTKKQDKEQAEAKAALELLHPGFHAQYLEAESVQTKNAQFAKSIDKIAPDILDYLTPPEVTIARYKHYMDIRPDQIMPIIRKHKAPYMAWNPFLSQFHQYLMDQAEKALNAFY